MKATRLFSASLLAAALAFNAAGAADTNTYQVTGPVLSVTPTTITVQKEKEKYLKKTNAVLKKQHMTTEKKEERWKKLMTGKNEMSKDALPQ